MRPLPLLECGLDLWEGHEETFLRVRVHHEIRFQEAPFVDPLLLFRGEVVLSYGSVQILERELVLVLWFGHRLGFPHRTPYASTKWGVVGFVKSLAAELGPEGVRVNAILPGVVEGPRIERVFAARAEALGLPVEEVKQENLSKVSLRAMVSAEDTVS